MKAIEFKSLIDWAFFDQLFATKKKKLFSENGKIIVVFKKIKAFKKNVNKQIN